MTVSQVFQITDIVQFQWECGARLTVAPIFPRDLAYSLVLVLLCLNCTFNWRIMRHKLRFMPFQFQNINVVNKLLPTSQRRIATRLSEKNEVPARFISTQVVFFLIA